MRKALSEAKDSRISAILKSGNVSSDASSKRAMHSPSTTKFRRTTKKNPGMADHSCARNHFFTGNANASQILYSHIKHLVSPVHKFMKRDMFFPAVGSRDGILSSSGAADRRSTYRAWKSSLSNDTDSIDSTFYNTCKILVPMNQGDISYKDSLMSYMKDLGPIAQMVAKEKLLEHHESNGCIRSENSAAKQRISGSLDANKFRTFRDFAPCPPPFIKASNIIDLTQDKEEANGSRNSTHGKEKTDCGTTPPGKEKTECGTTAAGLKGKTDCSAPGKEKTGCGTLRLLNAYTVPKKGGITKNLAARDSNCSTSRGNNISYRDDKVRPVILALENHHSSVSESKSRNKKSCIEPTGPWRRPRAASGGSSGEAATGVISSGGLVQQRPRALPALKSQFTFDLPFLKAQLNQMNALGTGGEIKCTRQAEPVGIIKPPFLYNQSRTGPSFDKLNTNLVLQL
ncbi:hypothetical protein CDL12_21788 [Handroanthus impetiginosus]|uniref:Uncharacterized protein n=1 Tax=Handroanthus impetiginosus TaxID=429701 RepID=A0A2G9GK72_9LAMI|nr:hypothetical protein CDL12_21788 [Handroanthus impetiginosus]